MRTACGSRCLVTATDTGGQAATGDAAIPGTMTIGTDAVFPASFGLRSRQRARPDEVACIGQAAPGACPHGHASAVAWTAVSRQPATSEPATTDT